MKFGDEEALEPGIVDMDAINAALRQGAFDRAEALLDEAAGHLPDEPETQRLRGLTQHLRGSLDEAVATLRAAHRRWPAHAGLLNNLGGALRDAGDVPGAVAALRRACELDPQNAAGWYNLGVVLAAHGGLDEASAALARALECNPDHLPAQLAYGDMLARLGRTERAAARYRATLQYDAGVARAWIGLAQVAGASLSDAELAAFRRLTERADLADGDRIAALFALARVAEVRGEIDSAWAAFADANAAQRRRLPWQGEAFSQQVDAVVDAFAAAPAHTSDAADGRDVVLLVGLAGEGADHAVAALRAHPGIAVSGGASELATVIQEESSRRAEPFPRWVAQATPDDWARLGQRYLERSARWRRPESLYVDAALPNWPFLGAAFAMLPGVRVLHVRGGALDTVFSAYRRLFPRASEAYSYGPADLARHWQDHERMMLFWQARFARRIHAIDSEQFTADAATTLRDLMAFLGLPAARECGKAVVAMPREAPASAYGQRLDPLRRLLDPYARR